METAPQLVVRATAFALLLAGAVHAGDKAGDLPLGRHWADERARPFIAAAPSLGAGYVQIDAAAGYGKPYFLWAGAEAFAFSSPIFAALYGGLRASSEVLDLRVGARRVAALSHVFVPRSAAHSMDDFGRQGPNASYTALELELSGGLPAPGGFAFWDLEWIGLSGVPEGYDVYDEWIKVAARPPSVGAARLGWIAVVGRQLKIGPWADFTATFGRGTIARVGPFADWQFTDHLDLLGALAFAVRTPDSLGLIPGAYGTVRLQWRWATGEQHWRFP